MGVFVRAVISGFGFSLGAALFKRVSRVIGFEEGAGNGESAKRGDRTGGGDEKDESEHEEGDEIEREPSPHEIR